MTRTYSERKQAYTKRLREYLENYKNILIIQVDHVGSNQMQQVRMALRGKAVVMMGKNTIMRKVVRDMAEENIAYDQLLPHIVGNMGFIFTNEDLNEIRKVVIAFKTPAAARTGVVAPVDVVIPPGPTPLDPGQTSFFQAMNIATKISRGAIEIVAKVHLIKAGERVSASAVALLGKLDIKPFFFGIQVLTVYENGTLYDAKVLDLDEATLLGKFFNGVRKVAAVSMAINIPTEASLPHAMGNAFRKLLAISVATEYTFAEAQPFKDFLENPEAFAAAAAPAGGDAEEAAAAPVEEEEEEEEEADGADLFGDDGDDY